VKGGNLFAEPMPLLAGRTVLVAVAEMDGRTRRVNRRGAVFQPVQKP
jgi:hypothetical protein